MVGGASRHPSLERESSLERAAVEVGEKSIQEKGGKRLLIKTYPFIIKLIFKHIKEKLVMSTLGEEGGIEGGRERERITHCMFH